MGSIERTVNAYTPNEPLKYAKRRL